VANNEPMYVIGASYVDLTVGSRIVESIGSIDWDQLDSPARTLSMGL